MNLKHFSFQSHHKLNVGDILLLAQTASRNHMLNREIEWLEVAVHLAKEENIDKANNLKDLLQRKKEAHDQYDNKQ